METIMTWQEMKEKFPDEWLVISDYKTDKYGTIITGIVRHLFLETDEFTEPYVANEAVAFRHTGESKFEGLRSHATHDHLRLFSA